MTNEEKFVLNFDRFGGPVYSGRDRGELARTESGIDKLDDTNQIVISKVPSGTYTITSSFFLGLFGPSMRKAGSRKKFLDKYQFEMSSSFEATLESCIQRALRNQSSLIGDN